MKTLTLTCTAGLLLALAAGLACAQETYKWVDEKGVTNYGTKPPAGRPAKPVDTTPSGPTASGDPFSPPNRQTEAAWRRPAEEPPPPASPPPPQPAPAAPVRGMDFQTFIRLQRGMTEGELLQRAGAPDHQSVENFRHDIVKTWYYFPTTANPFTTSVTMRGGRIAHLDRVKRF